MNRLQRFLDLSGSPRLISDSGARLVYGRSATTTPATPAMSDSRYESEWARQRHRVEYSVSSAVCRAQALIVASRPANAERHDASTIGNRQSGERARASPRGAQHRRSEEHTSELQSLMRISYAVSCLTKTKLNHTLSHNETRRHTHV